MKNSNRAESSSRRLPKAHCPSSVPLFWPAFPVSPKRQRKHQWDANTLVQEHVRTLVRELVEADAIQLVIISVIRIVKTHVKGRVVVLRSIN